MCFILNKFVKINDNEKETNKKQIKLQREIDLEDNKNLELNNSKENKIKEEIQNKKLSIYLGSYEGNLFSVELDLKTKETESYKFKVSENSLKVITHQSHFVFTSGIDEMIHIYDMKKKQEKGLFVTYAGSISNIFIVKDFLLACGDDCNIPIWRLSDFGLLHNLKGHKKGVVALAVHKSGKFCISSSKDNTIIVWNLMNGLKIIKYNLKNLICNKIVFCNDDDHAAIVFDYEFWIFNYLKNSEQHQEWIDKKVKSPFKIFDAIIIGDNILLFSHIGEIAIYEGVKESNCKKKDNNINIEDKLNIDEDAFVRKQLDKPEKADKEDLDIRIKAINSIKGKKLGLLNVIFSNNEIFVYDLNKILNLENFADKKKTSEERNEELNKTDNENKKNKSIVKKFKSINLKTGDRLTCLDSQIFY